VDSPNFLDERDLKSALSLWHTFILADTRSHRKLCPGVIKVLQHHERQ
jgi:hypothetical protein